MEHQQRRDTPITTADGSAGPDTGFLLELAKKSNVPSYLLLDSIRFRKEAETRLQAKVQATVQAEVARAFAVVDALQSGYTELASKFDSLQNDSRASRAQLGVMETRVQRAGEAIEGLKNGMEVMRNDVETSSSTTVKNSADISRLGEKVKELETRPLVSQEAKNENMNQVLADMNARLEHITALLSLPTALAQGNKLPPTGPAADTHQGSPSTRLRDASAGTDLAHAVTRSPKQQPPVAYRPDGSPRQAKRTTSRQNRSKVQARQQRFGTSVSSRGAGHASSSIVQQTMAQSHGQQSGTALPEEEATSGMTKPAGALRQHLKEAVEYHAKHSRTSRRIPDIRFMCEFIREIEDRELSKQLQMFLLHRFDRLVRMTRAGARLNRFVTFTGLEWPLFAQGVGEFLKSNDHM